MRGPGALHDLAEAILTLAVHGNMPDSYFLTDRRIALACDVLGIPQDESTMGIAEDMAYEYEDQDDDD